MTFEEFACAQYPPLMRFAVVLTGERAEAEDIVQEVLIRAYCAWHRISRANRLDAYVRRMVVNEFISRRRRVIRLIPAGDGRVADAGAVADHGAEHAERHALLAELSKLPERQRAVLVLRYYEGLADREIAETLGCPAGTVRCYASRALAALRIEMTRPAPARAR